MRVIFRIPIFGRLLLMVYRAVVAGRYVIKPLSQMIVWLFKSREVTNFTYDLDPLNYLYLAAFCAQVTGEPLEVMLGYMDELQCDRDLRCHLQETVALNSRGRFLDQDIRYGRRLGWYAIARAAKPHLIIETGVAAGLGACVLSSALERNREEGYPGQYIGTEINPEGGYLLQGTYAETGSVRYGDSITTLEGLSDPIDLFINDSDHSESYEAAEYAAVQDKLSPGAYVLSDNAHVTRALMDFARKTNRSFLFFQETPFNHWYPGAGIGAAFIPQRMKDA